jgi:hypothetical protein
MATPRYAGFITFDIDVHKDSVEALLMRMDTALSPFAIASFLGGPVEEYIRSRAAERFANEGDDVVGKWAPLKPATQAIRAQEGYGAEGPINRRTDELMNYIVGSPGRTQAHGLGATLTYPGTKPVGETSDKMRTAQVGEPYSGTTARPVLGLGEEDLAVVLTLLSIYVGEAISPL